MSKNYRTLSKNEALELINSKGTKKVRSHSLTKTIISWRYCSYCGIVTLKNKLTRKTLRSPCITYE